MLTNRQLLIVAVLVGSALLIVVPSIMAPFWPGCALAAVLSFTGTFLSYYWSTRSRQDDSV